jgi:hypothetical protein
VAIFQLPQKFQIVHGASNIDAGVRLMPFTFAAPVGAVITSTIAGKLKVPPLYLILCGSVLQVIGFALLATLPGSPDLPRSSYGYEVIAGFGSGINGSLLLLMMPFAVEARDRGRSMYPHIQLGLIIPAVAIGLLWQLRNIGGVVLLAICTSIFNDYVTPPLRQLLTAEQIDHFAYGSDRLSNAPSEVVERVKTVYALGYNRQMAALCIVSGLQILASLVMWKRKQMTV